MAEGHPLEHAEFAGGIPEGPCGAGHMENRGPRHVEARVKCVRALDEERIDVAGVAISHASRPIPGEPFTKLDLVRYYEAIAPTMLADMTQRPLSLVRCPGGDFAHCFFRRHADDGRGGEDESGIPFVRVRNLRELVASVQGGTIEFHGWGASAPRIDRPDRITLDLDPDAGMAWSTFREACNLTRELLDRLELRWFVKTTGGKGLHFVVPIARRYAWDEVKDFARRIAERLVATAPNLFTANMSKAKRADRVFVDYLRNAAGASAIASYSARARKGLPVSMPSDWEALADDVRGAHFSIGNVPKLVAAGHDPWRDYSSTRQTLTTALRML
jgi:bifunctional non-homologous end joining protein LigD